MAVASVAVTVAILLVRMSVGVIVVVPMGVPVRMPMVVMVTESRHAYQVHCKSQRAHNQQLAQSFRLCSLPESFEGLKCDFDAE